MPRGGRTRTSGQGRRKGIPNTLNRDIKEMIVGALCAAGGENYLLRQAEENPIAFMGLIGRVLPLQLAGHDGGRLEVEFRWRDEPSLAPVIDSIATDTDAADDAMPTITFIGEP